MKINTLLYIPFIVLLAVVFNACKKQELFDSSPSSIVNVTLSGISTKNLEFVFRNEVVAKWDVTGGTRDNSLLLDLAGDAEGEIQIREMGSTEVITTRTIKTSPFKQNLSLYYDNGKMYSNRISYKIKGYVMSGELEFLLDGKNIITASSKIDETIDILVNEDEPRQLEIRKSGETIVLLTDEIEPDIAEQSLGFFFNGTEIVDGIEVAPPKNPENMAITAQFKTFHEFTDPNSVSLYFTGGSEIDLVFYTRKIGTENTNRTTPENKVDPEIRITIPTDGTFVNFELPPLADPTMEYSMDIYLKDTDEIAYIRGTKASATYPTNQANKGRYGDGITFESGQSKLLLISDGFKGITQQPRHRVPIVKITDLSEYFQ